MDGTRIDRHLTIIGVMLVVLSMIMATQYATTRVGYSYNIVHQSNADIRFIASDNSTDRLVLRSNENTSAMTVYLGGNWSENFNKTYTAAFGIVNEENFSVIISNVSVATTSGSDYMRIWLHSDRNVKAGSDASGSSVMIWSQGSTGYDSASTAWVLGAGNQDPENMNTHGPAIETEWNETAHVRYSVNDSHSDAINGTDDFVWVQISVDIPAGASIATNTGIIFISFRADTTT